MSRLKITILLTLLLFGTISCEDLLEPKPVDLLTDDLVLNEPNDVPNVEVSAYRAFGQVVTNTIIAGDLTADMLSHNGTFTQYRELGTKQITSANASAADFWRNIYATVYICNFIFEKLPDVQGVATAQRNKTMGTAHLLRGLAYFYGLHTFGGIPDVRTTSVVDNQNIPRASIEDIKSLILDDFEDALAMLPEEPVNAGFVSKQTVHAALARFYLYEEQWAEAEVEASVLINSGAYELPSYPDLVAKDFTTEAIFEIGYNITDDPGTLNNLFKSRREIIPSNQLIRALDRIRVPSGDRQASMEFDVDDLEGADNGWAVAKYGTADNDNNNIVVFRLGEMHLIRAEARAHQGKIAGIGGAQEDINVLRNRAQAEPAKVVSQDQMILIIEDERRMELAFEGHRWYDLVRTARVSSIMNAFSANWKSTYERWPIPQPELQTNPALAGQQNPGY